MKKKTICFEEKRIQNTKQHHSKNKIKTKTTTALYFPPPCKQASRKGKYLLGTNTNNKIQSHWISLS